MRRYLEAAHHGMTDLTYTALIGKRKQSVQDAERMFSSHLLKFMAEKGYDEEATYIETIMNWRRAIDERGLSQEERKGYCHSFLQYIEDELIPWKAQLNMDYSTLEVNRYVHTVCIVIVFVAGILMYM